MDSGAPRGPRPTRRRVLQAALALPVLTACTPEPPAPPPVDPDRALLDAALARERELVAAYDAALLAAPALAGRLAALRGEHVAHLDALQPAAPPSAPPSPSASASPSVPGAAAEPAALLAGLAAAETRASAAHARDALPASRGLAVVLATLAASEATHAAVLA